MSFIKFIEENGIAIDINKGEHVFMQGDADRSIYFVRSGLLKAYYSTREGKEFIKSFLMDKDVIGSLSSAYKGASCSF